jgi:hypothetical protein
MLFAGSGALWGRLAEPGEICGAQNYRFIFNKIAAIALHCKVLYASRFPGRLAAWPGRHGTKFTRRVGEGLCGPPAGAP